MTMCARCGGCCEAITTSFTKKQLRDMNTNAEDKAFILKFWTRILKSKAHQINPRMGNRHVRGKSYYRCARYDPDTKLCTAHEDRPPICRNFPWYGQPPGEANDLGYFLRCSFWRDIPRDQWPEGVDPLPSPDEKNA